jgi:tetratricopeptide (TPR) repeat protein
LLPDAGRVVAHDGVVSWYPDDGQTILSFGTPLPPSAPVAALPPTQCDNNAAEDWYQQGLDLEPFDAGGAQAAYRQAISISPQHAGAHVNLGRLLQTIGLTMEAIRHYRTALECDPGNVTAAFNLGTALEEAGLLEEAVEAYRLALRINPALPDAHYNLSLIFQRTGHRLPALMHLHRFRELTGQLAPSP